MQASYTKVLSKRL